MKGKEKVELDSDVLEALQDIAKEKGIYFRTAFNETLRSALMMKKKTFIINNVEYETETHDFNNPLAEIKIPEGWRLWTAEECIKLHNNKEWRDILNLNDCWFFIKQPFDLNHYLVARFVAISDGAGLYCVWDPTYRGVRLGVRFCKDLERVA